MRYPAKVCAQWISIRGAKYGRPCSKEPSFLGRLELAWLVFTGSADAVTWPDDCPDGQTTPKPDTPLQLFTMQLVLWAGLIALPLLVAVIGETP